MDSMAIAIDNMIEEIKKPVDSEINGSARKAELQSIKQTAIDCKELIVERQKLESKKTKTTQEGSQSDSQSKQYWWKNMTITDKDKERYKFWEDMWNGEYES